MMLPFKLAFRNVMGGGIRTWLNVIVLAFTFILIVFYHGLNSGWNTAAKTEAIEWSLGKGQLRHNDFDLYDPFTIADGHGHLDNPQELNLEPELWRQASIYLGTRMISSQLRGISVDQTILKIPMHLVAESNADIPVIIGKRMAASTKLGIGDETIMRWRDANGTYDATNITIVGIFDSDEVSIDEGQIWMDIEKLWEICDMPKNEATFYISIEDRETLDIDGWNYHNQASLVKYIDDLAEADKIGAAVMYLLLLAIALLAIFDTQVLSIFRRQREIGTYISLGLTRPRVVAIFTVEGSMYSILACIVGVIAGFPLFYYFGTNGIVMGDGGGAMAGVSIIYPVYGIALILSTTTLVIISSTIVSFLPAKKIATMDPVDALKGKLQ